MNDAYLLTLDVDWAPDFAIEGVMDILIEKKVKATWFVTHDSEAVRKLFSYPELFELGIHPNFMKGSTQGSEEREIVSNLLKIVPGAVSVRTHSLHQSLFLLKMLREEFNLKNDVSLFLPGTPDLVPHKVYFSKSRKPLLRFPYFWQDDFYIYSNPDFSFSEKNYSHPGLKIFTFHPFFLWLNILNKEGYEQLKKVKPLSNLSSSDVEPYVNKGKGMKDFFLGLVDHLSENKSYTISELANKWKGDS